jgi:hypothetical protein
MKNLPDNLMCREYYDRKKRKHPVWKTEAEFQAIFQESEAALDLIKEEIDNLKDYLRSQGLPFLINEEALISCRAEIEELEQKKAVVAGLEQEKVEAALAIKRRHVKWIEIFDSFASDQHIKFEFLVIYTDQFNSGFRKQEFGNIKIQFPEIKEPCRFSDVSNVLKSEQSKGEKFFFLYYTREYGTKEVNIAKLIQQMLTLANDILLDRRTARRFI